MHLVLGVPVHLDPLGRPVLDVASAVHHREVVTCNQTNIITVNSVHPAKAKKCMLF